MTADQGCDLGLIGLGVMGRNFALNVASHGFSVAGCDLDADKVQKMGEEKTEAELPDRRKGARNQFDEDPDGEEHNNSGA